MIITNMHLRPGTKDDIPKIADTLKASWLLHADNEAEFINRSVIENTTLVEYFANCFDGSGESYLLIAMIDNNIAGFAKIDIKKIENFFKEQDVVYIDDLCAIESYRRMGVSTFLLDEVEKFARGKGIKCLKARVYSFNEPAQGTFGKAGFKDLYAEYFKNI